MVAVKAYQLIYPLTSDNRATAFVLDNTMYGRNRSKKVELLAKVYDHASNKDSEDSAICHLRGQKEIQSCRRHLT